MIYKIIADIEDQKFSWLLTIHADFDIPVSDCQSNFIFILGSSGS